MNLKELATNLGLEEEEFLELVDLFVETAASDMTKLEAAISHGVTDQTVQAAHAIKGAAGNLGFQDIYDLAKQIEMNARQHVLEGNLQAAHSLRGKLSGVAETLKAKQMVQSVD
jgi:HPt (histidine-containing phosphotransfer) domain-containing protein